MAWHRLKHKTSGEVQFVADLAGIDTSQWDALPISRAPTEFESVADDGSFVVDEARKLAVEQEAAAAALTRRELMSETNIKLVDALLAEGVLTITLADKVKKRII